MSDVPVTTTTTRGLHQGLTRRQISMMGLGGAIGAGLFVGSGQAISNAGPAVLISYLVAGTIVVLVMTMLAEMVAAKPAERR
jgi:AAT family amino acid transporter